VIWRYLFHTRYGLINHGRWYRLGIPILSTGSAIRDWAMPTIILFAVWKNFGYNMVIYPARRPAGDPAATCTRPRASTARRGAAAVPATSRCRSLDADAADGRRSSPIDRVLSSCLRSPTS
jgi:hypothetical protein